MALINTLIRNAGAAAATLVIDGIQLGGALINALSGVITGQAFVVMFADALAGGQDFQSNTNRFLATATASSSSWFGSAASFGLAIVPPVPVLIATSGTSGIAAARAVAGIGTTTVSSAPFGRSLLAHLGVMALDPRPMQPPARALLRAYFQLPDGRQKEFWSAALSVAQNPTANRLDLSITDSLNLIRPNAFRRYRLPDGSQGFMLRNPDGIDIVVPVPDDPDALNPGTQLRFEASTGADSTLASTVDKPRQLKTEITRLFEGARSRPRTITSVLREARRVAEKDPNAAFRAISIALAATDTENDDESRRSIIGFLGRFAGPRVVIDNVPRAVYVSDATFSEIRRLHFTAFGVGNRPRLSLTVNGRRPQALSVSMDPGDGIVLSGGVSWTFERRRRGAPIQPENLAGLGLRPGANQVVLTAHASNSRRVSSAELFIYYPNGRADYKPK